MKHVFRVLLRVVAYGAAATTALAVIVVAVLWLLLPRLDELRPEVEQWVSDYVGQEITIARLDAGWHDLNLTLRARGVRIAEGAHRGSRMRFGELYLSFDPLSVFGRDRTFERLTLNGPVIEAARLADGRIRVGDTIIGTPRGTLRRLLQGRNLTIIDGTLVWRDARAAEEELRIENVDVSIRSLNGRRRFEFTASPPQGLLQRFRGSGHYDPALLDTGAWTGDIKFSVARLNLERVPAVVQEQLPWHSRGRIDADIRAEWTRGMLAEASANVVVDDFVIPYATDATPLSAQRFTSALSWKRSDEAWRLVFTDPELVLEDEVVSVSHFELERQNLARTYSARDVDVQALLGVVNHFDIELPWSALIDSLRPRGIFSRAALTLVGPYLEARDWRFEGDFRDLGWRAQQHYPGVQGLDGRLSIDEDRGELTLDSMNLELNAAGTLPRAVNFDRVAAAIEWYRWGGDWIIDIGDGEAVNGDLHLADIRLSTRVQGDGSPSPHVVARLRVPRADIGALRDYLPVKRMSAKQVEWLNRALAGGELSQGRFYLNGPLDAFPFEAGGGVLKASAHVRHGVLDFDGGWPNLKGLEGVLELDGTRFEARASHGRFMRSTMQSARIWSDHVFRRDRILFIEGGLAAEADDIVRFLRRGPLIADPPPPHRSMNATGTGTLALAIELPFTRLKSGSRVRGRYEFQDVTVAVADGLEFTDLAGSVDFTERSVESERVTGRFLDGPVEAAVATVTPGTPMRFEIAGAGSTDVSRLTPVVGSTLTSRLAGEARWQGRFLGGRGPSRLEVSSGLGGVEIQFPAPLRKPAATASGIDVSVGFEEDRRHVSLHLKDRLSGELHYDRRDGESVLQRGVLSVGGDLALPGAGLSVSVRGEDFDVDQWLSELERLRQLARADTGKSRQDALSEHLRLLNVDVRNLRYLHRDLGPVEIRAISGDGGDWRARLSGPLLEGTARVQLEPRPARYDIEMSRLHWPRLEKTPRATIDDAPADPSGFAHLSIRAGDFRYGNMSLGAMNLEAGPDGEAWVIRRLSLRQPDLSIEANGRWTADGSEAHRTNVRFAATAGDLGNALTQLGLARQIASGRAEADGTLSWSGEPGDFSLGGVDGDLSVHAEDGRFLKLEPGSGRLLGLFNVETLARRFKLDFTDVFQEGLAFDRINGSGDITRGRLRTDGIQIVSPAALLELNGSTHLDDETYDLEVTVAPQLGANLSLAGAIANPAAGAMIFVMQKLFKKQMAKLIYYKYHISGDWSDPRVKPVGRPAPDRAPERHEP